MKPTELRQLLRIAADHLAQYRAYSESMCAIGRGCSISSAYQPETLAHMLTAALQPEPSKGGSGLRVVPNVDTSTMTRDQLYAHFKKTAPMEDLRFWLRPENQMSAGLRAGFEALKLSAEQMTIPRAAFYRQLSHLQGLWRQERDRSEREYQLQTCHYDHVSEHRVSNVEPESDDSEAIAS